ncbi:hypothetical protein V5O48_015522 [Marasmius crinis-equi]|uniref:F-box domain-containing protein n=1 Tax=Marasmius crinis-equi TaxID=585013 RepID=A0ABR3EUB0_9AGAR
MAVVGRLPAEIIDSILSVLRALGPHHLTACAMVCKLWLSFARFHLYVSIALPGTLGMGHCVLKLKSTMASSPLSVLVRELDIDAMHIKGQDGLCLSSLPSLRKLLIHSVFEEDVRILAGTILPRLWALEHLGIHGTALLPDHDLVRLLNAIAKVQSLKHLAFSVPIMKPLWLADALASATPRTSRSGLLSLDLRDPTGVCPLSEDVLGAALIDLFDLRELRSLAVNNATQSLAIVSQIRDTLEELVTIQRDTFSEKTPEMPFSPPMLCGSLRHLWIDIPPKIYMDILFRIHCPSLERITLTCSRDVRDSIRMSLRPQNLPQWQALDERLLELTRSTALREVNVVELFSDASAPGVPWEAASPSTREKFRQMLPRVFRLGLVRTQVYLTRKEAEAEARLLL